MDAKEQEFLKRLLVTFRVEADEHLHALSAGLIDLEHAPEPARRVEIAERIFREAHGLKGAARSVNLKEVEALCQPLESTLAALKRQEMPLTPTLFDLLHQTLDTLTRLVSSTAEEYTPAERAAFNELGRQLNLAARGETPPVRPDEPGPLVETAPKETPALLHSMDDAPASETVRIPIAKLDQLLLQSEEMIQPKLSGAQRVRELREIRLALAALQVELSTRKARRSPQPDESGEPYNAGLEVLADKMSAFSQAFEQDQRVLRLMVDEHLEAMKQILMLPASTLVEGFPKLVRDLARGQGKDVQLVMRGTEIEIDRRILQELKDPLIHLLRNCVDHGLEKPEARARLQKPARGTIAVTFSANDARQVEILVYDDGAGIDAQQVRESAMRAGFITPEAAEKLNPPEIIQLIFQSGISTSQIITDISGRGLGLAIVREKVEKLGGRVVVETVPGMGSTFRLRLPLALATFRGVLVREREQLFVFPTSHIERTLRVKRDEIRTVENHDTISFDGSILPLVNLGDILGLQARSKGNARKGQAAAEKYAPVLVVTSSDRRIAVQVDEVLSEEEVLVKGLGRQLSRVRNILGATVLGGGSVVPVLNIADLMISSLRPGAVTPATVRMTPTRTSRIMVAEDSITSRSLLKNILETGGFAVSTAVDGVDAFTQLATGDFDLLVSDVDMPRMSGFELTAKVRADKKLAEMPVILVTSLESIPDRERGIEVGANAYIVKSSFSQSNLLEVIQRLL